MTLLVSWLGRDVRQQGQKVGGWGGLELESESLREGLPHVKPDLHWTAAALRRCRCASYRDERGALSEPRRGATPIASAAL